MINLLKGFVWVEVIIVVAINANVEAEHTSRKDDQPEPTSTYPPFGNSLFLRVNAYGVQIYSCEKTSLGLQYSTVGAESKLYHAQGPKAVGYYYYLSRRLAEGGQPTFSFSRAEGDPISAMPESTVTVITVARMKANSSEDIDDVLLKATSHSGYGHASKVSYVQRRYSKGGVPPSSCTEIGRKIHVPYSAQYFFWSRDRALPSGIPPEISVSGIDFIPLVSFYAEGYQNYTFNGSSWIDINAMAFLYNSPGQDVVGRHFYLEHIDQEGGQPSWEVFMPHSRVTAKVVNRVSVDRQSVTWSKLEVTSYGGEKRYFGDVKYVQRLSTVGGLPPPSGGAKFGENYLSPYSAIYWFYVERL